MRAAAVKIISGFLLSVVLTLASYFLVVEQVFRGDVLLYVVMTLAVIQAFIQLILFLHLGEEEAPKWKLMAFWFMMIVLVIIVSGSIWIMYNLDYNMMITK